MTISNTQLSVSLFALTVLCLASVAFAQESTNSISTETSVQASSTGASSAVSASSSASFQANTATDRIEMQENMASNTAQRRAEVENRISDRKITLQARSQERVTNLAANMSNRMEAVIARLQNVSNRLQSRIEKLQAEGIDTSEAENALASAQISIDAALDEMRTIDAEVVAAISSEDVATNWGTVKNKFYRTQNHIVTIHTELRASIAALKQAAANPPIEQSTEAEVESTSTVDAPSTSSIIE